MPESGKKYWRSLEQLADEPGVRDWMEREFPAGAAELSLDGVSRRNFLKLMGASAALAGLGLSACRRPELHLVPFSNGVEWNIPGKALFYATSMPRRGGAMPLVVTTVSGRPVKIEGNPLHPVSNGGTDLHAQASVLELYDPDRSRFFLHDGDVASEDEFNAYLKNRLSKVDGDGGARVAFLVEENHSPTRERLRKEIAKKLPNATWYRYEPTGGEKETTDVAFGPDVRPVPDIGAADVIVSLDDDFLGTADQSAVDARDFSTRRSVEKPGDTMNRLYVVENRFTVTGGMADHRLRVPASHVAAFAYKLAQALGAGSGMLGALPEPFSEVQFPEGWIEECAADLLAHKGRSLVTAGARQPAVVHYLAFAINSALGNVGSTVTGIRWNGLPYGTLDELADRIKSGRVATLFIFGGNPVYTAPADLEWETLQKSVPNVIHLGLFADETAKAAKWHVPAAHYLESWGDALARDGSYMSVQPMILPLYGGWSELDMLCAILGHERTEGPEQIQETFRHVAGNPGDFEAAWKKFLHDGFITGSEAAPVALFFNETAVSAGMQWEAAPEMPFAGPDNIEIVFATDASLGDGRFANNGWLQEMPDPVTKLSWDNAVLMSPSMAGKFDVGTNDVVKLSLNGAEVEGPVVVSPGHAEDSVTVALGYGRLANGRVSQGVGFNVYPLRNSKHSYFQTGLKLEKTGKTHRLACTQDHGAMEGRAIVREGTVDHFKDEPNFAQRMGSDAHKPEGQSHPSIYPHPPLDAKQQWGMVVDLNTCTGCSACVVACQAENNIPIVGKEQVLNGREMHWIRTDRYFTSVELGDPDPAMVFQPMMCQHCENAPCETVCPVNATVHSSDGLNVMTYNRCIGTRYCSNNCPFKVRRFNFFDYNSRPIGKVKLPVLGEVNGLYAGPLTKKGSPDTIKMQKNPNVTVRMRGVMEKCTFCLQRIEEAKIGAKVAAGASPNTKVPTDGFKVACQQVCPSQAISFGDIADLETKVAKQKASPRNYEVLGYLNVNTRVTYLARLKNPNSKMPGAEKVGVPEGERGFWETRDRGPFSQNNATVNETASLS